MIRNLSFIWDLDGTLFDSYPAILPSAWETCREFGLDLAMKEIRDVVLRYSVKELLRRASIKLNADQDAMQKRFDELSVSRIDRITSMPHAEEVLSTLKDHGCEHFVYTHRGESTFQILDNLGLTVYFTEILTRDSGFPRKPDPKAVLHLMEKYHLDPDRTYYVGDRNLDMQAAENAGIKKILYLVPDTPVIPEGNEEMVISDLRQVLEITAKNKGRESEK